jgi:hypothetical protein
MALVPLGAVLIVTGGLVLWSGREHRAPEQALADALTASSAQGIEWRCSALQKHTFGPLTDSFQAVKRIGVGVQLYDCSAPGRHRCYETVGRAYKDVTGTMLEQARAGDTFSQNVGCVRFAPKGRQY